MPHRLQVVDRYVSILLTLVASALAVGLGACGEKTSTPTTPTQTGNLPVVSLTTDRTVLAPGETAVIRWTVTGTDKGGYQKLFGWPSASSSMEVVKTGEWRITPCPGVTPFTLQATNAFGTVETTLRLMEPPASGSPSVCGNWGGTFQFWLTDSDGSRNGTGARLVLSLPQWGAVMIGTWHEFPPGDRGPGGGLGTLDARLEGAHLVGTLTFPGNLVAVGGSKHEVCPASLTATISEDWLQMTGTYQATCTLSNGVRRTFSGSFAVSKHVGEQVPYYPRPID